MGKASDLAWWIDFAQTDYRKIQKKVEARLMSELDRLINGQEMQGWIAPRIGPLDFVLIHGSAKTIVDKFRKGETISGSYTVQVEWLGEGNDVEQWVDHTKNKNPDTGRHTDLVAALFLKALMKADIQPEQIKHCTCGNIIFQQGKREKKYCSNRCRNKAREDLKAK